MNRLEILPSFTGISQYLSNSTNTLVKNNNAFSKSLVKQQDNRT
jgi:hypothetical protein